ncbi:MAG: ATP-grasp fold amidoligase family protein [Sphaerochaeta sp.]|nr:ATP-grasp fold amidoligase family protein [Sphaerochaeta sp.]
MSSMWNKLGKKLTKIVRNPQLFILRTSLVRFLSDETCVAWRYKSKTGNYLDLSNPNTFNEKIQWLKLHDHNPEYQKFVDKYAVREYVSATIGSHYLIPLIGVYNDVESIPFQTLPNTFVLKCTHDSGGVIVCKDKEKLDIPATKKILHRALKKNLYWHTREWPYKNIEPKIICEKYLVDESGYELKDYKISCFHGEPRVIQVMSNRKASTYNINHYDTTWNELHIERKGHGSNPLGIEKPKHLEKMLEISRVLAKGVPYVRVDLYQTEDAIYFGELTLYPGSGCLSFAQTADDEYLGSMIHLSQV